jgi:hypothetical protein
LQTLKHRQKNQQCRPPSPPGIAALCIQRTLSARLAERTAHLRPCRLGEAATWLLEPAPPGSDYDVSNKYSGVPVLEYAEDAGVGLDDFGPPSEADLMRRFYSEEEAAAALALEEHRGKPYDPREEPAEGGPGGPLTPSESRDRVF